MCLSRVLTDHSLPSFPARSFVTCAGPRGLAGLGWPRRSRATWYFTWYLVRGLRVQVLLCGISFSHLRNTWRTLRVFPPTGAPPRPRMMGREHHQHQSMRERRLTRRSAFLQRRTPPILLPIGLLYQYPSEPSAHNHQIPTNGAHQQTTINHLRHLVAFSPNPSMHSAPRQLCHKPMQLGQRVTIPSPTCPTSRTRPEDDHGSWDSRTTFQPRRRPSTCFRAYTNPERNKPSNSSCNTLTTIFAGGSNIFATDPAPILDAPCK